MKRSHRRLAGGLLVILLASSLLYLGMSRDIPAPDASDFRVELIAVPPDRNAYTWFLAATNDFHWPSDSTNLPNFLAGLPADEQEVENIVHGHEDWRATMRRGLECTILETPEWAGSNVPRHYLNNWLKFGKMLAIMARHERRTRNFERARDDCLLLIRFGDMVQGSAKTLIDYLVGVAVLEIGFAQAHDLALDEDSPQEVLRSLASALESTGPFDRGFVRAVRGEYAHTEDAIRRTNEGSVDPVSLTGGFSEVAPHPIWRKGHRLPAYFFQPNRTRALFLRYYRRMIANASRPYADMDRSSIAADIGLDKSLLLAYARPNAVGNILGAIIFPAMEGTQERLCRAECGRAATGILIASVRYQRDKGMLPEDLRVLAPAYLTAIPADPYDGKPFRYVPAKGILYSVGPDLKDGGGDRTKEGWAAEDVPQGPRAWSADYVFDLTSQTH